MFYNFTVACCVKVLYLEMVQYICTQPLHTYTELAEYVMNKCITQAGEDHPVKYNFDILEDQVPQEHHDQVPQEHHDHYTLVWMVSNQMVKACVKCIDCSLRKFLR